MRDQALLDKIDLHLIRVLHTVLTDRSVSRAAIRLGMYQPAVSAALKRLRELSGDPLLVRSGSGMVPTDAGLRMIEPAAEILRSAEVLFSDARGFDPQTAATTFRIAASDYLDPQFLPMLVAQIKSQAPLCRIEIHALSSDSDYHTHLSLGQFDLVIGNWLKPPEDLHMARLFGDEIVSLVNKDHPAVRRGWDLDSWLAAEHIAPTPMHPGGRGIIDQMLDEMGRQRNITARCAHFGLIPDMVASSLLVLVTGRQYCERFLERLPVAILDCPIALPRLMYYQLWHERTHSSSSARWLRERIKSVAASLRPPPAAIASAGAVAPADPG
ncbi:LysR family transcriptional regulator [Variovorax sp. J22P168]|uniref:LysR family transcriptional regulator n=1 Tax=Variovorax jilinensis TaxID=3053513 RepID=UPI0025759811|nr:LysR family transcriptional regulator [Variovorax sp. J22P168]MDM0011621.1 LysR family transcriptional regulator [Variovorax sp. J22P168]